MANGGNVVQRIVRLIFDRNSATKAERESKRSAEKIGGFWKSTAGQIVAALNIDRILRASARAIGTFIRGSAQEAAKADGIWKRLDATLNTVGVRFEDVEGSIRGAASAMQDTTKFGDEDFAEALQGLIALSGDFEGSLRNVGLVFDFATLHGISAATAVDVVGKAMAGNFRTLKQYNIEAKDAADALRQIREQSRGMAEADGRTLEGQTRRLANAWGDFKEEIGKALIEAGGGISILDTLTVATQRLTNWVTDHKDELRSFFVDTFREFQVEALKTLRGWLKIQQFWEGFKLNISEARALEERIAGITREIERLQSTAEQSETARRAGLLLHVPRTGTRRPANLGADGDATKKAKDEIDLLAQGLKLRHLTAMEVARVFEIEAELSRAIKAGIADLEKRNEAMERFVKISEVAAKLRDEARPPQAIDSRGLRGVGAAGGGLEPRPITGVGLSFADNERFNLFNDQRRREAEDFLAFLDEVEVKGQQTAALLTDAFQTFFSALLDDSQSASGAMVAFLLEGLAQYLEIKAAQSVAEALLGHPGAAAAAVGFSLAAGLARALEGQLGRSAGGGRASVSTGASGIRSTPSRAEAPPTQVTINLHGSFGALAQSPDFQTAVGAAGEFVRQTWGENANFHLNVPKARR